MALKDKRKRSKCVVGHAKKKKTRGCPQTGKRGSAKGGDLPPWICPGGWGEENGTEF